MSNAPFLLRLLPLDAPLSTLRVVTSSLHSMHAQRKEGPCCPAGVGRSAPGTPSLPPSVHDTEISAQRQDDGASPFPSDFSVVTAVLRAGRAGALTDHDSVCFPVDPVTGFLSAGRSNQVWSQSGCDEVVYFLVDLLHIQSANLLCFNGSRENIACALFQHWYKLGLKHLFHVGQTHGRSWTSHPDDPNGVKVEGLSSTSSCFKH